MSEPGLEPARPGADQHLHQTAPRTHGCIAALECQRLASATVSKITNRCARVNRRALMEGSVPFATPSKYADGRITMGRPSPCSVIVAISWSGRQNSLEKPPAAIIGSAKNALRWRFRSCLPAGNWVSVGAGNAPGCSPAGTRRKREVRDQQRGGRVRRQPPGWRVATPDTGVAG